VWKSEFEARKQKNSLRAAELLKYGDSASLRIRYSDGRIEEIEIVGRNVFRPVINGVALHLLHVSFSRQGFGNPKQVVPHFYFSISKTPMCRSRILRRGNSANRYQLEWDIPAEAPCLNPRHPHLSVFIDSSGYREGVGLTQLFCLFLGGTGLALFVVAGEHSARWKFARALAPRMFHGMVLRNVMPVTKHAPLRVIHELPHWGLFWGAVLWMRDFYLYDFRSTAVQGLVGNLEKARCGCLGEKSMARYTRGICPHTWAVLREQ
jgi:hypothetical protein